MKQNKNKTVCPKNKYSYFYLYPNNTQIAINIEDIKLAIQSALKRLNNNHTKQKP